MEAIAAADVDTIMLDGVLRRSGARLSVRVWHILTRFDWEDEDGGAEDDAMLEREMRASCERERARLERLTGAEVWRKLVKNLSNETEVAVGVGSEMRRYPAVFTERIEGRPLFALIDADHGCGGEECDEPSASLLDLQLATVKAVAYACLVAMRGAHEVGLAFEPSGTTGPFPAHVRVVAPPAGSPGTLNISDFSVCLTDVEGLQEMSTSFTAKPLVHSPLGNFIRSWWLATAPKLGVVNGQTDNQEYAAVLSRYGTLNWLLFSWEDERLGGEEILRLLTVGPVVERSAEDLEMAQRRWNAFTQEAFVRLGPRRFDEMKAQVALMNDGEITAKDVVARARYFMCPDHEDLHEAFKEIILG